jgi:hypothetical protein
MAETYKFLAHTCPKFVLLTKIKCMAELAEIEIQNQTYKFERTFLGLEKIINNNTVISKKWSLYGTKHNCLINGDLYVVQTVLSTMNTENNYLILFKKDQILKSVKIVSKAFNIKGFFIGIAVGVVSYFIFRS